MWFEVGVSKVSDKWRKCQLYSSSGAATELPCRTFKRDTVENSVFNRVLQASLRAFRLASWTVLWECLLKGNSGLLILIKFSIHCQKTETLLGILHYCHLTWWLSGTEDGLEAWGGVLAYHRFPGSCCVPWGALQPILSCRRGMLCHPQGTIMFRQRTFFPDLFCKHGAERRTLSEPGGSCRILCVCSTFEPG